MPSPVDNSLIPTGTLMVEQVDGRILTVPIEWYPRRAHGTQAERADWRLIGKGQGIQ